MKSLCSLGLCRNRKGCLTLRAGTHSHIGLRKSNDDLVCADEHCRLYVALDGIGGSAGGAEASRVLLEQLTTNIESMCGSATQEPELDLSSAVLNALTKATEEMQCVAKARPEYEKMGAVFALAYIVNDTLLYTHVGDARVYLVRQGRARQLTTDETYVQLMVDVGVIDPAEVPEHPMRNVILNAVGTKPPEALPTVHKRLLLPGDVVLLTTDGVSDKLDEEMLGKLLNIDTDPAVLAKTVVEAALLAGTSDNASCVVVRVDRSADAEANQHDDLQAELAKLHEMLLHVDSLDDDLRKDMAKLADEIRDSLQATEPNDTSELGRLRQEISDRALEFEVSHPHLTNVVASIVNLLARIGI